MMKIIYAVCNQNYEAWILLRSIIILIISSFIDFVMDIHSFTYTIGLIHFSCCAFLRKLDPVQLEDRKYKKIDSKSIDRQTDPNQLLHGFVRQTDRQTEEARIVRSSLYNNLFCASAAAVVFYSFLPLPLMSNDYRAHLYRPKEKRYKNVTLST